MDCKSDMYWKGYNDYPNKEHYPTLDIHTTTQEGQYIQGWWDAQKHNTMPFIDDEPSGLCWLGDY